MKHLDIRRMTRLILAPVVALLAALLVPAAASADAYSVTIDCGDGSPITATVDLNELTEIQAALQAMINYPSGLSCTLSQNLVTGPVVGTNAFADSGSFVVGGGQYIDQDNRNCLTNFGISGHMESTGSHGTQTYTVPDNPDNLAKGCTAAHLKADGSICVGVNGNKARIAGVILKSNPPAPANPIGDGDPSGVNLVTDVTDNSPGAMDHITEFRSSATFSCNSIFVVGAFLPNPVVSGDIHVHS
jgi:hypothetical protein